MYMYICLYIYIYIYICIYIYLRNISSIISSHNRNILSPKQKSFGCNCRVKNECPLNGECQTPLFTYRTDVINDSNDEELAD